MSAILPQRKANRLRNWDYSCAGTYFITICACRKQCLFGDIREQEVRLSPLGLLAEESLSLMEERYRGLRIDRGVTMPNHLHLLLFLAQQEGEDTAVTDSISWYKSRVSRLAHKRGMTAGAVWQRSFHDHIVRGEEDYRRIAAYIENNPMKWEQDCFYRNG